MSRKAINVRDMSSEDFVRHDVYLNGVLVEALAADEAAGIVELAQRSPDSEGRMRARPYRDSEPLGLGESAFRGLRTFYAMGFVQIIKNPKKDDQKKM